MRQIVPPFTIIKKVLGVQKPAGDTPYRLTAHCMRLERPEVSLLYHTLTGELLLLSHDEATALGELPGAVPPALEGLISRWFLRPVNSDDMALANQVREIAERFAKKGTALTKYTIFTTTACNARCFYCFEAGWKTSSMSEQTALDTAKYIADHCGGKPVHIEWFGGEPLVNVRAIDIITDSLQQQKVKFRSEITTNGYLFDESLVQRARDVWNLEHAQITLDGTEDVYNQRKAYVNPQGSPFKRVLRNIDLLLKAGIHVKARLNMDMDNEQNLYALVDELAERFAGKLGFGVYIMVLQENAGVSPSSYMEEERLVYAQKLSSLQTYVEEKGISAGMKLKRGFVVNACMADNSNSTTVTPDGLLGRCESNINGSVWGSIYSDTADKDVLKKWKIHKLPEEICKNCFLYPQCIRLENCPGLPEHCSPIERTTQKDRLRRAVLSSYEEWKTAGQS